MVRKWSYLNNNLINNYKALNPLLKVKTFKVFRKTTKFKKFTKGITRVVRKKYTKRIFFTSYFTLPQITKWWSFNYIQSKQLERFTQSLNHSPFLSNMPNFEIFHELAKSIDKSYNLHTFSCSKTLIYRSVLNHSNINKALPILKKSVIRNAKISFTQTNSFQSSNDNDIAHPLNFYFENLTYHPQSTSNNSIKNLLFDSLQKSSHNHVLAFSISIYKIIIKLALINLSIPKI
jgi:hypothetical protein